jgi:hypothetical protein
MKKITIAILMVFASYSITSAMELGINVGVTGNVGVFHGEGKDTNDNTNNADSIQQEDATGVAGYTSFFIEKTLWNSGPLSRIAVGYDKMNGVLSSETAQNIRDDLTNAADATTTGTSSLSNRVDNTIQVDFENMETIYVSVDLWNGVYAKMGEVTIDMVTNESLATGSSYGNIGLDAKMFGLGFEKDIPYLGGMFMRFEGKYMDFENETASSGDNTISIVGLEGASGALSIGKSF